jgi:methylmalonyl-CoA carboxyltransferase large subunit
MHPETAETVDWAHVVDSLGAIRRELTRLGERVAALEAAVVAAPRKSASGTETETAAAAAPAPAIAPEPEPQPEVLSEELLVVISAAIAAFLGKKPYIRQIRLLASPAWAEHGRITIQASHKLSIQHR